MMEMKSSLKKRARKDSPEMAKRGICKGFLHTVCQHRRGTFEFSCGFTDHGAQLTEKSLDGKERRGG
jgi:hypothetical protein